MAFPFKTGGDFYNCEAQRMRLHNLGANPTETATGLMYFNTGTSNLGKHAVVHDGTNFKALAFVDEIATNTAFTQLAERVLTIEKALGEDTANVIDTWEEIQNFLKNINDNDADLMTMLNSKADKTQLEGYLPLSGGTITGALTVNGFSSFYSRLSLRNDAAIEFSDTDGNMRGLLIPYAELSYDLSYYDTAAWHRLLHSGNYNSYAPKLDGTGATGTWGINISGKAATASALLTSTFKYAFVNGNNVLFGYETAQNNYDTILAGKNVTLRYGATPSIGLWLNSSGNVTIGGSDLAGTDAKLYVDGSDVGRAVAISVKVNKTLSTCRVTYGINPSLSVGNNYGIGHLFGVDASANNMANIIFRNAGGNGSANNFVGIGLYGNDNILNVLGSGNVGIGTTDPQYKLDVAGTGRFTGAVTMGSTLTVGGNITPNANNAHSLGTSSYQWSHLYAVGATLSGALGVSGAATLASTLNVSGRATLAGGITSKADHNFISHNDEFNFIPDAFSGVVYFNHRTASGSFNGNIKAYRFHNGSENSYADIICKNIIANEAVLSGAVTIKGDLVVEGNIIGKKEVSAGGAGQEGESGAGGGAEVISQTLASGASSYTITNTIKRSDIAVSLYEWNASGNSWDMCLADISVTNSQITVTFGSATTVNHKLVAVG